MAVRGHIHFWRTNKWKRRKPGSAAQDGPMRASSSTLETDFRAKEKNRMGIILLVLLVLFFVGALPSWPHSRSWGYYPSGGLGAVLAIVLILVLLNRI